MTLSRGKYKRLPELFTQGKELELQDGTALWLQVLNPYEQDEARHDAMVARARLVVALKDHGSDEMAKVISTVTVDGIEAVVDRLLVDKRMEFISKAADTIANDPEWKERLEVASRQDEIIARPITDPERQYLDQINADYVVQLNGMVDEETDQLRVHLDALTEDELVEEYKKFYIDRRGLDIALAEHQLTEIWYATRCCEGKKDEAGVWSHEACEGHTLQVWEKKSEVQGLPEALQQLLHDTIRDLNMTVREAKNSDRQANSSASSPVTSEPAESIPSIPVEIPDGLPGTSLSP